MFTKNNVVDWMFAQDDSRPVHMGSGSFARGNGATSCLLGQFLESHTYFSGYVTLRGELLETGRVIETQGSAKDWFGAPIESLRTFGSLKKAYIGRGAYVPRETADSIDSSEPPNLES